MGKSKAPAPRPVDPREQMRIQMEMQAEAEAKKKAGWASDASQFASNNPITEDWRADILGRSQAAGQQQIGMLNQQLGNTFQDIRQRQAAQGLGSSAGRFNQAGEAQGLGQSSRADIMGQATNRANALASDRQRFMDTATRNIRGGQSVESASEQFKSDLADANSAFEQQLASAPSGDQRNQAYKDFELGRSVASQRYSDAMASVESDALTASAATFGNTRDDERLAQGQALYGKPGGGAGQSTPLG
jgi:hypothetical protein